MCHICRAEKILKENILEVDRCSYCNISPDETGVHHTTCEGGCDKKICDSCRMKLLGKEWMIVDYEPDNDNSDLGDSCMECFDEKERKKNDD